MPVLTPSICVVTDPAYPDLHISELTIDIDGHIADGGALSTVLVLEETVLEETVELTVFVSPCVCVQINMVNKNTTARDVKNVKWSLAI